MDLGSKGWTWYSNISGARKQITHVFFGSCWRLVQNFRDFQSSKFAVATLKIWLKSRKMAPSIQVRLDVLHLQDERVAHKFKLELVKSLGEPDVSNDAEKLWTNFKTKVLKVSERFLQNTPGLSKSFLSKDTLNIIEESRRARL